jgi:branched-subunit amino acid permease
MTLLPAVLSLMVFTVAGVIVLAVRQSQPSSRRSTTIKLSLIVGVIALAGLIVAIVGLVSLGATEPMRSTL